MPPTDFHHFLPTGPLLDDIEWPRTPPPNFSAQLDFSSPGRPFQSSISITTDTVHLPIASVNTAASLHFGKNSQAQIEKLCRKNSELKTRKRELELELNYARKEIRFLSDLNQDYLREISQLKNLSERNLTEEHSQTDELTPQGQTTATKKRRLDAMAPQSPIVQRIPSTQSAARIPIPAIIIRTDTAKTKNMTLKERVVSLEKQACLILSNPRDGKLKRNLTDLWGDLFNATQSSDPKLTALKVSKWESKFDEIQNELSLERAYRT